MNGSFDAWQGLFFRLQSVANNRANGGCEGVAIIEFSLFFHNSCLVGWSKPDRIPLEPKQFDTTIFDLRTVNSWNRVIMDLKREQGQRVAKILVIRDGEPVGWLEEVVQVQPLVQVIA